MAENDSDSSERYEFDAPSHVVDLKELQNAEVEEKWFDMQANGGLQTPVMDQRFKRTENRPRAVVNPLRTEEDCAPSTSEAQPSNVVVSDVQPSNVVTSWGGRSPNRTGARPKTRASNPPPAQPCRVSKRKGLTTNPAPPTKKHRNSRSPVAQAARKSVVRKNRPMNPRPAPNPRAAASTTANTEPNASELRELERIRDLQNEVVLHRKQNEASYKAALAGNPPPKKMVLSATVPKEFHFTTDTRVKATTSSQTTHKEVDFIAQLRKPSSPAKAMKGATVPKPFNLSRGNKRKEAEGQSAYVSTAQQIAQFHTRTPDRYHLRSRRSQERGPSQRKGSHLKLTQPHTPHLMTVKRSRPTTVKSSSDMEEEELEKLHKFQFKALELNRKILEGVEGLKRPAVKEPTVPEGFELQIDKRLQERQAAKPQEEEEKSHTFKSQPLPKKMLEGVTGLPEKKVLPPTVPESPAFALKKRIHVASRVEEVKQPSPIKAPPVPHFGMPFQPRLPEHHHVEVCPFSFEDRERERRALKEKKLQEKRNEEVSQFKAQPLPDFDTVNLPEKKKLEATKPEPFRLLLDERGAVKSSRWEQMMKEEQKQQEEAALFKARPNTVTHKQPFQPKKESRAAMVVEAFELSTERRARERQEYERVAGEKEALRMMMEEDQRREEEQRETEEIAKMRQDQVHKAQPIRHYKPVALKKSELPLTIPHSPNFSDRFRL